MKVVPKRKLRVQLVTLGGNMSSSIDYGTLALGALVGVGCRKQLKSAAKIAVNFAANLAGAAATAVSEAAEATQAKQSPEERAAAAWTQHMDQQMSQQMAQPVGNGKQG